MSEYFFSLQLLTRQNQDNTTMAENTEKKPETTVPETKVR